jgi:hypothetical protein
MTEDGDNEDDGRMDPDDLRAEYWFDPKGHLAGREIEIADELARLEDEAMSDDDVDPNDPRPAGHYGRDATWYYISDDQAWMVSFAPATDAETGDDWILSFLSEVTTEEGFERVCVRLTPRALRHLYFEAKDSLQDILKAESTAGCGVCGEPVLLEKAVPNPQSDPVHRHCYVDAYDGPEWLEYY